MQSFNERQADGLNLRNWFLMIIRFKEAGMSPIEVTVQPTEAADTFDANHIEALHALMKLYESGEILDEEESEVDLMIQLSGMVYHDLRSDEQS